MAIHPKYRNQYQGRIDDLEAEVERLEGDRERAIRRLAEAYDEIARLEKENDRQHRLIHEMASQQRAEVERLREDLRDADEKVTALSRLLAEEKNRSARQAENAGE